MSVGAESLESGGGKPRGRTRREQRLVEGSHGAPVLGED